MFSESVGVIECVSARIGGCLISPALYSAGFWEEQIDTPAQVLAEIENSDMEECDKQRVI